MKKILFIILLLIYSFSYCQTSIDKYAYISKCVISHLFYQPTQIMTSKKVGEIYRVSYKRPTDHTLWINEVKFDGNKIKWRAVLYNTIGRWREEDIIIFKESLNKLIIESIYEDGNVSTEFTKQY